MGYRQVVQSLGISEAVRNAQRAALYEARLKLFGPTATIFPMGDPVHQSSPTNFNSVGEEQDEAIWSEAPTGFDVRLTNLGLIPLSKFNGSDEQIVIADDNIWSRDDSNNEGLTLIIYVNVSATVDIQQLITKWLAAGHREWQWQIDANEKLRLVVFDENAGQSASETSDSAITLNTPIQLGIT